MLGSHPASAAAVVVLRLDSYKSRVRRPGWNSMVVQQYGSPPAQRSCKLSTSCPSQTHPRDGLRGACTPRAPGPPAAAPARQTRLAAIGSERRAHLAHGNLGAASPPRMHCGASIAAALRGRKTRVSNCRAGRACKPRVQVASASRPCPRCAQLCSALGAHLYCVPCTTPPDAPPGWASTAQTGRTTDRCSRPSAALSSADAGLWPLSVEKGAPVTRLARS